MWLFLFLQDYVDSLKGLCYDGMEGLLYLSLYSFLSALAFTAILCSLPGAWRSFPRWEKRITFNQRHEKQEKSDGL